MKILIVDSLSNQVTEGARAIAKQIDATIDIAIPSIESKRTNRERFKSKYIKKVYKVYPPTLNEKLFESSILEIIENDKYDLILPFGYKTTIALSKIKSKINQISKIFISDFNLINLIHDKQKLAELLLNGGFNLPKIYSLEDIKSKSINFPLVIKARKTSGVDKAVRYANNMTELKRFYKEISSNSSSNHDIDDFSNPLIQEYVCGTTYDGLFLCENGEVIASMAQRRDVVYPSSGGVGVEVSSILDDDLINYCSKILKFINWTGPCQVEVIKDNHSNSFKLIEINPKLWGTLGCSIKAGVNFPLLIVQKASYNSPPKINQYKLIKYSIIFPMFFNSLINIPKKRIRRFFKMILDVLLGKVKTEIDITDLKPNILRLIEVLIEIILRRGKNIIKSEFNATKLNKK